MSSGSRRARALCRDSTKSERMCWELLRAHRLDGYKFRHRHPIGHYFADFGCPARKLVIEINGEQRAFQAKVDAQRTAFLENQGWQ